MTHAALLAVVVVLIAGPVAAAALGSGGGSPAAVASSTSSTNNSQLVPPDAIRKISTGRVAVLRNWLPPRLVSAMRSDARSLFDAGQFNPDGLTNTALGDASKQGFTGKADRQTFRGGADWNSDAGHRATRKEFESLMDELRRELASALDRPTLATEFPDGREGSPKHEMTYNWYEPGAKLGRHLDEHHEETKGTKGWTVPTRRSVTWLVYLNDDWAEEEGGWLRCFPRVSQDVGDDDDDNQRRRLRRNDVQVGSHMGNLQVGWLDDVEPVFLDCFSRESGGSALYRVVRDGGVAGDGDDVAECEESTSTIDVLSRSDFDVPPQPVDFSVFLAEEHRSKFEQISTSRRDPRFAGGGGGATGGSVNDSSTSSSEVSHEEKDALDILPAAGTLVLFDSVSLPHRVREVTGGRQRIAATGWFHEDSQFVIDL
ncbi:hypothetical protein ACHAWF_000940 [Thalassiosira exigua]